MKMRYANIPCLEVFALTKDDKQKLKQAPNEKDFQISGFVFGVRF